MPKDLHDGFWNIWVRTPLRAQALVNRLAAPARFKAEAAAAADPVQQAIDRLGKAAEAAEAAGATGLDETIIAALDALAQQIAQGGGAAPPAKTAKAGATSLSEAAASLFPGLYEKKGNAQ